MQIKVDVKENEGAVHTGVPPLFATDAPFQNNSETCM